MNAVFTALVLLSLAAMAAMSPSEALPAMVSGVTGAVTLSLKLTAIYAVWLSVLRMMQETGLDKKLSRGLRPLIKRLFKGEKEETYDLIAVNLASDLLGMGGAATAAGIDAMRSMSDGSERASDNISHSGFCRRHALIASVYVNPSITRNSTASASGRICE